MQGADVALRLEWTEDQTKRALYLYFQLPFGQLHKGNPEIIALAKSLARTPSSVAMKLANFASLDQKIIGTGRKGLTGASKLDRRVWDAFNGDWTELILDVGMQNEAAQASVNQRVNAPEQLAYRASSDAPTTARAVIERRVGQSFFRRAVLANFDEVCCVTGLAEPRLLVASHISPWSFDVSNRHNPRNGLCLSATFDKAFDKHLMTVTPDLVVRFSSQLLKHRNGETRKCFAPFEGKKLKQPTHLMPDTSLLSEHNARFIV